MAEISLSQDKIAIVDDADLPLVESYTWSSQQVRHHWYAVSGRRRIWMHRLILDAPQGLQVDHIDGDGLNNQRSNLRLVTQAQNQQNRRTPRGTSRFKGVSWRKNQQRWRATIKLDGKTKELGNFQNETEAARAYDRAASEHYGSFACTNEMLDLY